MGTTRPAAEAAALALAALVSLAAAAEPACEGAACAGGGPAPAESPSEEGNWLDDSFGYLTDSADTLAQGIDDFFGEPDAERESADSVLRLLGEHQWDSEDGTDLKLRLRGKVDLPQLDRRLSLVFGEEDDFRRDVLPPGERQDSDVGLQYELAGRERSRLYFSVGTNASLDARAALRFRYLYPIDEALSARFTERVYYREGEGFGTITRADLDYRLSENRILRWTADGEYGEETDGIEWGSRLSYLVQISPKEALSYFTAVSGETDPRWFTGAYAVGVRYRRSVFRPWVFVELEPSHLWRRDAADDDLDPAWAVRLRVELLEEFRER